MLNGNYLHQAWAAVPLVPMVVFSAVFMLMMSLENYIKVRDRGRANAEQDAGSLKRIRIISGFVFFGGLALAVFPIVGVPGGRAFHFYFGAALVLAGFLLRAWAVGKLGAYFTGTVMTHAGQRIITDGPYRYVRHPAYTGALLFYAGWGMATGSLVGLIVVVAMIAYAFHRRIQVEEQVMIAAFGEEYSSYMKKTRRLVPGIY